MAEERISNVKTVRAFNTEEKESELYLRQIDAFWSLVVKEAKAVGLIYGFVSVKPFIFYENTFLIC